jgi:hypothetical protein
MLRGSRVIIVSVQVGAVKKYVAAVQAFRKTERGGVKTGWNSVYCQKKWCFAQFHPNPSPPPPAPWMLMYFFGLAYQGKNIMFIFIIDYGILAPR